MAQVTTLGVDIAKNSVCVHGIVVHGCFDAPHVQEPG
jgi:hypothetical protein